MGSGKIDLVKIAIEFVITSLKEFDRVSIIGFSDSTFIYYPLTVMNEQGKASMIRIINTLGLTGNTNIECGVRAALHMLADRKICNKVASILLLSDGCDNDTKSINKRIQEAIKKFKPTIKGSYKVHTFGYGKDHDPIVMSFMAELTKGNFYYVENEAAITDAFANCMGELVSLLASNVQVSLTTKVCEVPFKLSKVYSNTRDTIFTMPNLFFGDKKDLVFVLDFESVEEDFVGQRILPIEAVVTFTLINGDKTRKTAMLELVIAENNEEIKKDEKVLLEYYRVKGAESLKQFIKLTDAGKFGEAREVVKVSGAEISKSEVAYNPKIKALIRDIKDSLGRAESKGNWDSGGRARSLNIQKSHFNQIAMNNSMVYQNHVQILYSVNSNAYMRNKTCSENYSQSMPITQNYAPPRMLQQTSLNCDLKIIPDSSLQYFPVYVPQASPNFPRPLVSCLLQYQALPSQDSDPPKYQVRSLQVSCFPQYQLFPPQESGPRIYKVPPPQVSIPSHYEVSPPQDSDTPQYKDPPPQDLGPPQFQVPPSHISNPIHYEVSTSQVPDTSHYKIPPPPQVLVPPKFQVPPPRVSIPAHYEVSPPQDSDTPQFKVPPPQDLGPPQFQVTPSHISNPIHYEVSFPQVPDTSQYKIPPPQVLDPPPMSSASSSSFEPSKL